MGEVREGWVTKRASAPARTVDGTVEANYVDCVDGDAGSGGCMDGASRPCAGVEFRQLPLPVLTHRSK
jgi:uncharacterized membrane protein